MIFKIKYKLIKYKTITINFLSFIFLNDLNIFPSNTKVKLYLNKYNISKLLLIWLKILLAIITNNILFISNLYYK